MLHIARFLWMFLVIATCSGCASIVSGTNQSVSVVTTAPSGQEVTGAKCSLINDKGSWYVSSPGSVMVHRSFNDLAVNCAAANDVGTALVKSSTKGMAAGNILFGGIIGVGVDMSTGAAYDYPGLITVSLGQAIVVTPGVANTASVEKSDKSPPPKTTHQVCGTRPGEVGRRCWDEPD